MLNMLWLIPTFPLVGFLILSLTEGKLSKKLVPKIGVGSVGLSAILALFIGSEYISASTEPYTQILWTWMSVAGFEPTVGLYLDPLSLSWLFIVTGVGFLIHLYSIGFMEDDPGYSRFFAYMNLFVFSMLMLVLADNLVLLFLGWEGVGLCSYLLIGFWYSDAENGLAARKAFIVTRVGDTAMALGLFLLFFHLGTLDIQALMQRATEQWPVGSTLAVVSALLLLGGAVGKSAQLPLQTWLPDAMAGPTPISALIHAATMVTAGVYLVARTHELFILAPSALLVVAIGGGITLLMAGLSSLTQFDIKRIIAYSTISQIGYMFMGLGVGAWSASVFHVMTHAFFKSLLFLAAGGVIYCFHHEHNIFNMGGLRKRLPITFWSFMIGGAALAALPFTSGHYSKDEILMTAFSAGATGPIFWAIGVLGALLTGMYTFRLIFIVFFGPEKSGVEENFGWSMGGVLIVLCVLSLFGGLLQSPMQSMLSSVFPQAEPVPHHGLVIFITTLVPFAGILIAYLFYFSRTLVVEDLLKSETNQSLHRLWLSNWGMDALYDKLFVSPFKALAAINKHDIVDLLYKGIVVFSQFLHQLVALTQNGRLRWYATSMVFGLVLIIAIGAFS